MNETLTISTRGVPKLLRNQFKALCAKYDVSMQDAVIALMEIAIERNVNIGVQVKKRKQLNAKFNRNVKK